MIKVKKDAEPDILKVNKKLWTDSLLALVKKYKKYEAIPKEEKDAVVKHYADKDVLKALLSGTGQSKCIYCESYVNVSGFPNIEHFYPKSLYPQKTFCWTNLFVSCVLCNISKGNFDTKKKPFINPLNEDPEEYLTFDELVYTPKFSDGYNYQKARNVIDECDLDRPELVHEHADILCAFLSNKYFLKKKISLYNSRKTNKKRVEDARDILSALILLDKEASDDAKYAAYMRYLLRKYREVNEAEIIINAHKYDLGLPEGFKWSFIFY